MISILIALILYPVCFANELTYGKSVDIQLVVHIVENQNNTINAFVYLSFVGNRPIWEFGWAYGVGWGAAIFLLGGVILLLCDKESEEIYYKERKIVHESQMRA